MIKSKTKEITVQRTINYQEVNDTVAVYEDIITIGGTVERREGISEIKNLEIEGITPIKSDMYYVMLPKEFLDKWRKQLCDLTKEWIQNPYTEFDNGVIVRYAPRTNDLFDLNGNIYPKALYFDSTGNITNRSYDLEKLYRYLKLYPERFEKVEMRRVSYWVEESETEDEEALTHEIRFLWTPGADEYAEFYRRQQEHYNVFKENALDVAGVTDFKKSVVS